MSMNPALRDAQLDVLNFLNNTASAFPAAVSFSAGMPHDDYFAVKDAIGLVPVFVETLAKDKNISAESLFNSFAQYGETFGLITDHVARFLQNDLGIPASKHDILMTAGCQEAITICLHGLFDRSKDVLLVTDPTFTGVTGLARMLDIQTVPIPCVDGFPDLRYLRQQLGELNNRGKRAKAFYVISSFNNPLGTTMSISFREELLELSREYSVFLIEDDSYSLFRYDGEELPALAQLDGLDHVLYLSSFSKTLFPGIRTGFIASRHRLKDSSGTEFPLIQELAKVKSFISINTSPITQAIVGGVLIENNYSLRAYVAHKLSYYKKKRDLFMECLDKAFPGENQEKSLIKWNHPSGGFFVTLSLPFEFGKDELLECAEQFGVVCCPMSFFSVTGSNKSMLRLAFSYCDENEIEEGLMRLASYIQYKQSQPGPANQHTAVGVAG